MLLLLRTLELAFFVVILVCDGTTGDKFGSEFPWPSFFTSWCFLVFGAWALVGTALTASDLVKDSRLAAKKEADEEKMVAEQHKISSNEEKQEQQQEEDDWRRRPGSSDSSNEAAAAAACRSAPATPQRGIRNPRRAGEAATMTTSEDLEAAESNVKNRKTSAAPSPAPSSMTTESSADSRRLTAPPATSKRQPSSPSASPPPPPPPLSQLPPLRMDLLHNLYSLLSSVAGPSAIFVALMYWAILRRFIERDNPRKRFDPVDAMLHGGNALFLVLDVLLSRVPVASSHFQVTLAYGTAYSIFMWSYERATGRFIYGTILTWSRPSAIGFYGFALPGALLVCFAFWCLLAAGREALGKRMIMKREAESDGGKTGAEEEAEEEKERERERKGDKAERTRETTQWWTEENCASLPALASNATVKDSPSSLV